VNQSAVVEPVWLLVSGAAGAVLGAVITFLIVRFVGKEAEQGQIEIAHRLKMLPENVANRVVVELRSGTQSIHKTIAQLNEAHQSLARLAHDIRDKQEPGWEPKSAPASPAEPVPPQDAIGGPDDILRLYQDSESLERQFKITRVGFSRGASHDGAAAFSGQAAGAFWILHGRDGRFWAIPGPHNRITSTLYNDAGLKHLYRCKGYQEGGDNGRFRLIQPARMQKSGELWTCVDRGELEVVYEPGLVHQGSG
jgi:hypothetical protein